MVAQGTSRANIVPRYGRYGRDCLAGLVRRDGKQCTNAIKHCYCCTNATVGATLMHSVLCRVGRTALKSRSWCLSVLAWFLTRFSQYFVDKGMSRTLLHSLITGSCEEPLSVRTFRSPLRRASVRGRTEGDRGPLCSPGDERRGCRPLKGRVPCPTAFGFRGGAARRSAVRYQGTVRNR